MSLKTVVTGCLRNASRQFEVIARHFSGLPVDHGLKGSVAVSTLVHNDNISTHHKFKKHWLTNSIRSHHSSAPPSTIGPDVNDGSMTGADNPEIDSDDEVFEAMSLRHRSHRLKQLELLRASGRAIYPHNFDAEIPIDEFRKTYDSIKVDMQ